MINGSQLAIGVAAATAAGLGAFSIDQLARNDWNTGVILDDHAPLTASLPATALGAAVGLAAGLVVATRLAPSTASIAAMTALATGGLVGIGGAAIGAMTMNSTAIPPDRRGDLGLWAQQMAGWSAPMTALGIVGGITGGVLATRLARLALTRH